MQVKLATNPIKRLVNKMSYAIIRNEKYTKDQMIKLAPHNERVKSEYSNKNIDKSKSYMNYHLKKPIHTNYYKEFKRLIEQNNLKGQLHKNSIYACEMIVTSDKSFFSSIGEKETKRYFDTAYKFICNFKNLGDENILSAVVHMDEETPHMHITYIPVIDSKDKEGNPIRKIGGNLFWNKDQNSYSKLQDSFYEYVRLNGFKLDRGKNINNVEHFKMDDLKGLTNFYNTKELENKITQENSQAIYTSIKSFLNYEEFTPESVDKNLLSPLLKENIRLMNEIKELKLKISKIQNAIDEYNDIKEDNESLKATIQSQQNQINVYENLIVRLNDEKEKIVEKCRILGININKIRVD